MFKSSLVHWNSRLSMTEMDQRADSMQGTSSLFCDKINLVLETSSPPMIWMYNLGCTFLNVIKPLPSIVMARGWPFKYYFTMKRHFKESCNRQLLCFVSPITDKSRSIWSLSNKSVNRKNDNWLVSKEDSQKSCALFTFRLQRCRRLYRLRAPTSAWSTLILLRVVLRSSRITGESWLACAMVYFLSGVTFCLNRGGLSSRRYANKEERNFFLSRFIRNPCHLGCMAVSTHPVLKNTFP